MIRATVCTTLIIGALAVAGHYDQQEQVAIDQHYCEMVGIQKQWMRSHAGEIGREAALRRPGWPEHRGGVDCAAMGFFFDQQFSVR